MREWTVHTASAEQTRELGHQLGKILPPSALLLLSGDLGAGKTCFTQGLARGLGVPEEEAVASPTFTLMNLYCGRSPLHHYDLYRLGGPEDLLDLGFEESLHGDAVVVVEWAERADALAEESLCLHFSYVDDDTRRIVFIPRGAQYETLVSQLAELWEKRGCA